MKHTVTDPACERYAAPVGWWQRRRHDRARGVSCTPCLSMRVRQHMPLPSWPSHPERGRA